jgi:hypothetical protein
MGAMMGAVSCELSPPVSAAAAQGGGTIEAKNETAQQAQAQNQGSGAVFAKQDVPDSEGPGLASFTSVVRGHRLRLILRGIGGVTADRR